MILAKGYQGPWLKQTFVLLVVVQPWKDIRIDLGKWKLMGIFLLDLMMLMKLAKVHPALFPMMSTYQKGWPTLGEDFFSLQWGPTIPDQWGIRTVRNLNLKELNRDMASNSKVNFTTNRHGNANSGFFFPTTPNFLVTVVTHFQKPP